jgi:hypothetical protein
MDYPADLKLEAPLEVANWRPLVHWLLGVPHLLIAGVLGQVAGLISVIGWFAIVFTGRLPEGLANFQCLVIRYSARANSYAVFLRESYPTFDFTMTPDDPGGDPVLVEILPQLENRNRLTVGLRFIWIIPIALFLAVLGFAACFVIFVAFFTVLFTGRWPEGMRRFVVGTGRLGVRVSAYGYLLVDDYPPFSTD